MPPLSRKKQRKSLGSFFKSQNLSADALPLTEKQRVQSELESYLMSADADSESEPLEWQSLHEHNFKSEQPCKKIPVHLSHQHPLRKNF